MIFPKRLLIRRSLVRAQVEEPPHLAGVLSFLEHFRHNSATGFRQKRFQSNRYTSGVPKLKVLALAFFVTAALPAHAVDLTPGTVGLHLISQHAQESHAPGSLGWNNKNYGIYARWGGFTAGVYRNSLYKNSAYLGWTWETPQWRQLSLGLTAGVVSGYDEMRADSRNGPIPGGLRTETRCDNAGCRAVGVKSVLSPMLVPSVRLQVTDRLSARLAILASRNNASAMHLMTEWQF